MTISLATIARNSAGNSIVDLIDIGTLHDSGYIEIRDGTRPSSPQVTASGNLLATCWFSYPAFGDFANGQTSANTIAHDTNIANNGVASWFRVYNRNGDAVFDGDIGVIGSNSDIEFDHVNFIKGGTVAISTLPATMS